MKIDTAWLPPPHVIGGLDHIGTQGPCVLLYSQLLSASRTWPRGHLWLGEELAIAPDSTFVQRSPGFGHLPGSDARALLPAHLWGENC